MPQRDVLEGRLRIAPQHACEAADLFAGNWILLVRHRRGAFLLFAEKLLRLAHLGPLQVAHFESDFVQRAANDCQSGDVSCMAVALNNLRGHRRGLEAQPRADFLFMLGLQVTKGSHSSGKLAHAHILSGRVETDQIALDLCKPVEQFEAEGCRLGMDAVRAADGGRVLEFEGPPLENGQ